MLAVFVSAYHTPAHCASGVSRLVKRAGADTTPHNAVRDGAEWAWVPHGDACPFCRMLAYNGWLRVLSVNPDTGALLTDTTPPPDLTPYVRSSTLPDAKTPGPVRIDPQYGVTVREGATLTLVPASAEQLDSMTDGFAPLTPVLLPYGVKKALTTASTAAGWTSAEKIIEC